MRSVVIGSGLQEKLDEIGRHITQYSARHFAATNTLMRGVGIYDLAVYLGTSVFYIENLQRVKGIGKLLSRADNSKNLSKQTKNQASETNRIYRKTHYRLDRAQHSYIITGNGR